MAYCVPNQAGLQSTPRATCSRIAALIGALDNLNWAICKGGLIDDVREFRAKIVTGLEADGYVVSYNGTDRLSVYPPGSKAGQRKRAEREHDELCASEARNLARMGGDTSEA